MRNSNENERGRENCQAANGTRVECGLDFSPHAEHVLNFSWRRVAAHRNWRADEIISRLTNPRRGPVSLRPLSLDFLLLASLLSSLSSLYPLVSAARSGDALKLKTLEMGHSRHLSLSLSLFSSPPFSLSPASSSSLPLSFRARFPVGCLGEKDRGPKERASSSDVGCHSSYSFGSHVRGGGP